MVASRNRPKGARLGPFGLSVLALSLIPNDIGYQDLAALLVRQQDVSQRARAHALASPFGTIHAATFSFPRPIGTLIPETPGYRLVSIHSGDPDFTGSIDPDFTEDKVGGHPSAFPTVNRTLKGDLLVTRPEPEPEVPPAGTRDLVPGRVKTVSFPRPPGEPEPAKEQASGQQTYSLASLPEPSAAALQESKVEAVDPIEAIDPTVRMDRLYFGSVPVGKKIGPIQPWPGEQPIVLLSPAADPEFKRDELNVPSGSAGESIAPKGQVTGPGQRPKTPAERLGLNTKERAKAEKCLAEAVYFESRGEPKRGQIAVAQVVMNRVFSGYYPANVCEVVYQNAHRYNACQFTFACDRVKDVVNEPPLWKQANQIARDTLDGKLWLEDIGKSTHYHAYWVHPWWAGTMRKISRIGVHKFYRPKRWGDGSDAPSWGPGITAVNTGAAKL